MTTRVSYRELTDKFGVPTFADHLEAIADCDFATRRECAAKLGISTSTLRAYISGRRTPSVANAAAMAKCLHYSPLLFIEAALSDTIKEAGYNYEVKLHKPTKRRVA